MKAPYKYTRTFITLSDGRFLVLLSNHGTAGRPVRVLHIPGATILNNEIALDTNIDLMKFTFGIVPLNVIDLGVVDIRTSNTNQTYHFFKMQIVVKPNQRKLKQYESSFWTDRYGLENIRDRHNAGYSVGLIEGLNLFL